MGHAEHRRSEPIVGSAAQNRVQDRDSCLCTLDAEALSTDVLCGQELLERLSGVQTLKDATLVIDVEFTVRGLDPILHPLLLVRVLNMHVLDTDRTAVRVPQDTEKVPEGQFVGPADSVGKKLAVEIPDR